MYLTRWTTDETPPFWTPQTFLSWPQKPSLSQREKSLFQRFNITFLGFKQNKPNEQAALHSSFERTNLIGRISRNKSWLCLFKSQITLRWHFRIVSAVD
jgi:hypothetical protein